MADLELVVAQLPTLGAQCLDVPVTVGPGDVQEYRDKVNRHGHRPRSWW